MSTTEPASIKWYFCPIHGDSQESCCEKSEKLVDVPIQNKCRICGEPIIIKAEDLKFYFKWKKIDPKVKVPIDYHSKSCDRCNSEKQMKDDRETELWLEELRKEGITEEQYWWRRDSLGDKFC